MCISRVGKIVSLKDNRIAAVRLLGDDRLVENIDVSMLDDVKKNSYVEVFANLALSTLPPKIALERKKAWIEVMKARG
jgi:hydrogenase maturation factor